MKKKIILEYSFNAVKNCGVTSIAVRGENSVVTITQKKIPVFIIKFTNIFKK